MPGLLYYIPGFTRQISPKDWKDVGIGHAFQDLPGTPVAAGCQKGPEGTAGVVLGHPSNVESVGYYPDNQRWHKASSGRFHVGMFTDRDPPTPEDLQRPDPLPGYAVELADGQRWLVPIARSIIFDPVTQAIMGFKEMLPQLIEKNGDGHWHKGAVVDRWKPLWDIAVEWWDKKCNAIHAKYAKATTDDETTLLLEAFDNVQEGSVFTLATNYRLSDAEVTLLRLFSTNQHSAVLDALVDWPLYVLWIKKNLPESVLRELDGCCTDDGAAVSIPVTEQA